MYAIEYSTSAAKELSKLDNHIRRRIISAIDSLARTPVPPGAIMMQGASGAYRMRVGSYRVIYEVHHDVLVVLIIKIGDRKEVYK